jgi:hypothetical protein
MSICRVNGLAHEVEAGVITWGQLLATLERGDGPDRTVVAAVRFAGVDQPTFREAESTDVDLNTVAPIDVELSTPGALVAFARETALSGLDALAESARQAADAFRLHNLSVAHSRLADFVTTFQLLNSLTAAVDRSNESPRPATGETRACEFRQRMETSLGALIDFDVNEDWLSVADVLEYEIADLLPHWSAVMRDAGDGQPHTVELAAGSLS